MDRLERIESLSQTLLTAMRGWQTDMWTAIPGIVDSFDANNHTCQVQPSIRFRIEQPALSTYSSATMIVDPSGQFAWDQMPLLLDCPVVFPGGGGVTLTFPIAKGDEVLVVFANRCIDAWWQQGGIQNQNAYRMHDLSDGFVLPGVRSQPRKFAVDTTKAQLRTDDGTAKIAIDPSNSEVSITSSSQIVLNGGSIQMYGTVSINGAPYLAHRHSGVTPGGSNSGGVV